MLKFFKFFKKLEKNAKKSFISISEKCRLHLSFCPYVHSVHFMPWKPLRVEIRFVRGVFCFFDRVCWRDAISYFVLKNYPAHSNWKIQKIATNFGVRGESLSQTHAFASKVVAQHSLWFCNMYLFKGQYESEVESVSAAWNSEIEQSIVTSWHFGLIPSQLHPDRVSFSIIAEGCILLSFHDVVVSIVNLLRL